MLLICQRWNAYGQLGNGGTSTTVVPAKVKDQTGKGTLKGIIDVQFHYFPKLPLFHLLIEPLHYHNLL